MKKILDKIKIISDILLNYNKCNYSGLIMLEVNYLNGHITKITKTEKEDVTVT